MGPGEEIDNAEEEVPCQCEVLLSLESTRSASLVKVPGWTLKPLWRGGGTSQVAHQHGYWVGFSVRQISAINKC